MLILPLALLAMAPLAGVSGLLWPRHRVAEAISLSACSLALAVLVWEGARGISPAAATGTLFALVTAGLWLVSTVAATGYLQDRARTRYHLFSTFCLAGAMGMYAAADFLTLFVYFKLATLSSYALVIHEQTDEAHAAGRLYLYLGIAGGLTTLSGVMLLKDFTGALSFEPESLSGTAGLLTVALLGVGFWIKAGLAPFHFWLPRAHPVAPAPASALLSGVMIKTGVYGLYRSLSLLAPGPESDAAGQFLLAAGLASILLGGVLALLEADPKRLLAYSSVSQVGYLAVAMGALQLVGPAAAGAAGMGFYLLSHAFGKGALFILTGAIALKARADGRTSLAGAGRGLPLTALLALIAAGGLAAVPGLSGYPGKTLIQGVLQEASQLGAPGLALAPAAFRLGGLLTVAYLARFLHILFLAGPGLTRRRETAVEKGVAVGAGLFLLSLGLGPNAWLNGLVLPAAAGAPTELTVFGPDILKSLQWPLLPGLALFLLIGRRHFSSARWSPAWSAEGAAAALVRLSHWACLRAATLDAWLDRGYLWLPRAGARLVGWAAAVDCSMDGGYHRLPGLGTRLVGWAAAVDGSLDHGYHRLPELGGKVVDAAAQVDWTVDEGRRKGLPLANLNVASLLLVGVIVAWLLVLVVGRWSYPAVPPGLR